MTPSADCEQYRALVLCHESTVARLNNEIAQHKEALSIALGQLETMRGEVAQKERDWLAERIKLQTNKWIAEQERDVLAAKLRSGS